MALDQLKAFLQIMQDDSELKAKVMASATADDVARIAYKLGYEFSGDELLRMTGQKVGKVTVQKIATPGEYN
ncbi:Nif11-like leader peptide family natural product precursor [Thiosulfatimonas sediminis]|uniref:Nif11-like leader peptide family natural product n=1 Tax=Thiosulfatimonas sediminis TaxID=2675054 RepID=A0A6F8PUI4_9GAMM|nr:Nif11-like leader peptide family natural product precursor [Thiosulfatimonas sediminis]BBP45791.1 Nif11-like leader peptide family natural product precursor [Thiosulfatimonas sediminis]